MDKAAQQRVSRVSRSGESLEDLQASHQELDRRLAAIERHISLTSAEQAERTRLKKEKLRIKDRILAVAGRREDASH